MILRRVRLVSGLVLLTYLATHFINHALGLISLEAMETGRIWYLALWRNPLATLVLYGSLATHLGLAFYSLYRRRHLRMPFWEALQLVLGLTIPLFLAAHIAGTRLAHGCSTLKIPMRSSFFHCGMSRHSTAYVRRYWSPSPGCMAASACTSGCDSGRGTRELCRSSLASPYYFRCWRCSASPRRS